MSEEKRQLIRDVTTRINKLPVDKQHYILGYMNGVGGGWGVVFGGYVLGHGYLGSENFKGSKAGLEAIMRIMDVVGVDDLIEMKGKHVRVATKGLGHSVKIIGNFIKDEWFDYESFFKDEKPPFVEE